VARLSAERGTILPMPVVLLLAAVAILAGVVVVAIGRGGELAIFRSDAPPYDGSLATAADLAAFRPPPAFFGYSAQATDEALQRIARAVAARDAELALLRGQLAALRPGASDHPDSAVPGDADWRHRAGPWFRDELAAHAADASRPAEPSAWAEPTAWAEPEEPPEPSVWPEPDEPAWPEPADPDALSGWPGARDRGESGGGQSPGPDEPDGSAETSGAGDTGGPGGSP
jgi:hypothetical protein